MNRVLIAITVLLSLLSPARAWSTKEHIQLVRIAAQRLIDSPDTPALMKDWLREAVPERYDMEGERQWFLSQRQGIVPRGVDGLPYWAVIPDTTVLMEPRGQEKKLEPFGVPERLLHYIDLELFLEGDQKREYRHDLSGKPKIENISRDIHDERYVQAGMLPFRVVDAYQKLVERLRAGRLNDAPQQYPRDEHATKWAGFLAHYLADNTQPQHATMDYKSASYFANKRKAPNVHAQIEFIMADDELQEHGELRREFWPLFEKALAEVEDPIETTDLWQASVQVSMASYDALALIGTAAMAAAGQGGTPQAPQGDIAGEFDTEVFFRHKGTYLGREMSVMEMKAHQQAWAVKRIERVLRQAWDESQHPATPSTTQPAATQASPLTN